MPKRRRACSPATSSSRAATPVDAIESFGHERFEVRADHR